MCRPDDFPPYEGMPDSFFRTLDPQTEQEFRGWARENWTPDTRPNPMWHPVVRDEWRLLDEAADDHAAAAAEAKAWDPRP